MHAHNYQDVIDHLTQIVATARANNDQRGYFAALYRHMTITVKKAIADQAFEDNARMEAMVTHFANRYLDALAVYQAGGLPTGPWKVTFETTQRSSATLAQHLFLGMNAHILFDLGISAAETVPGDAIDSFKNDFDHINDILASLLGIINDQFGQIWPVFAQVDAFFGGRNRHAFSRGMNGVRHHAWKVATQLAPLSDEQRIQPIHALEKQITVYANRIAHPFFPFNACVWMLCRTNSKTVAETIDILTTDP